MKNFHALYQDIKGVSNVDVYGITDSIISVKIDDEKLAENQIPLQAVMGILQWSKHCCCCRGKNY